MFAKIVTAAISPLGTALLLLAAAFVARPLGRRSASWRRISAAAAGLGFAWLCLWSTPVVSDALRGWIEAQAGPRSIEGVREAPVIVVLGGGVSGPRPPLRPYADLNASADRMWHAARLYRAGKAGRIVLSGGTVRTGDGTEAEAMQRFLLELGVPEHAMVLEADSGDTVANASLTARLLAKEGIGTAILVTSALHMPRARAELERVGVKVHPAPTDFEIIETPFDILSVLPSAAALSGSARSFKELVGWVRASWLP